MQTLFRSLPGHLHGKDCFFEADIQTLEAALIMAQGTPEEKVCEFQIEEMHIWESSSFRHEILTFPENIDRVKSILKSCIETSRPELVEREGSRYGEYIYEVILRETLDAVDIKLVGHEL